MTYAETLSEMLNDGVDTLVRTVKAMPAEKYDWRPAETSRTARELLNELIMTTIYTKDLVVAMKDPGFGEDKTAWTDLADWEGQYRAAVKELLAEVAKVPEDKLHDKIMLPWGEMTLFQAITYAYWNPMYHYGQIAYIQTMYGDKDMY